MNTKNIIPRTTGLNKYSFALNSLLSLAYSKWRKKPFPYHIFFLITSRCNMNCRYCFVDPNKKYYKRYMDRTKDLTTEEIKYLIDELVALGTKSICFIGGEPLLRNDFSELVLYTRKKGVLPELITNGVFLDRYIDVLPKLDSIMISLQGNERIHDEERGDKSFQKIISNLELLKQKKIPFLFNVLINRHNYKHFDEMLKIAKHFNVKTTFLEAVYRFDKTKKNMFIPKNELYSFYKKIEEDKKSGEPISRPDPSLKLLKTCAKTISNMDLYYNYDKIPEKVKQLIGKTVCKMGKYIMYLDSDGTFYPCPNLFGVKGENIFEHGAEEAYRRLVSNTKCKFCKYTADSIGVFLADLNLKYLLEQWRGYFHK